MLPEGSVVPVILGPLSGAHGAEAGSGVGGALGKFLYQGPRGLSGVSQVVFSPDACGLLPFWDGCSALLP